MSIFTWVILVPLLLLVLVILKGVVINGERTKSHFDPRERVLRRFSGRALQMMNEQGFSEGFVREVIRNGSIQVRDSRILYRHTDIQGKLILVITSLDGEVLSVAV